MRYLVIGLGIYGENLARDLTDMGHEVVGADIVPAHVEAIKDYISAVYLVDSTDEAAMAVLPVNSVDVVIVAIGENFGASVKTVALLKKSGVSHIYARAIDDLHRSIFQAFGIDRILTPEQRAAKDLATELELGYEVDTLPVADDCVVVSFSAPSYLVGKDYASLALEKEFGLTLVAAARKNFRKNIMGISHAVFEMIDIGKEPGAGEDPERVAADDRLTVFGTRSGFRKFYAAMR